MGEGRAPGAGLPCVREVSLHYLCGKCRQTLVRKCGHRQPPDFRPGTAGYPRREPEVGIRLGRGFPEISPSGSGRSRVRRDLPEALSGGPAPRSWSALSADSLYWSRLSCRCSLANTSRGSSQQLDQVCRATPNDGRRRRARPRDRFRMQGRITPVVGRIVRSACPCSSSAVRDDAWRILASVSRFCK